MRTDQFHFADAPIVGSNAFVVRIPAGLATTEALSVHARFPDYFGFNWDALDECLRDFHWLDRREVVLCHSDLPPLPTSELVIDLDVVTDCMASWGPGEEHSLQVSFSRGGADADREALAFGRISTREVRWR